MEVKPFGMLTVDEQNALKNTGLENVEYFDGTLWRQKKAPVFSNAMCYRIKKVMSESECVAYLEKSEKKPADWPVEVQELALRIQEYCMENGERLFEFFVHGSWLSTLSVTDYNNRLSMYPHRLKVGTWPIKVKMSESECVAYLEKSEKKPADWPVEAQELAVKIQEAYRNMDEGPFEYLNSRSLWGVTRRVQKWDSTWSDYPHRLKRGMWPMKKSRILTVDTDKQGFRVVNMDGRQIMLNNMISHPKFNGFLDEQNRPCSFDDATYVELNK